MSDGEIEAEVGPRFRDATFSNVDLSGTTFQDSLLRHTRIANRWLEDVSISGWWRVWW